MNSLKELSEKFSQVADEIDRANEKVRAQERALQAAEIAVADALAARDQLFQAHGPLLGEIQQQTETFLLSNSSVLTDKQLKALSTPIKELGVPLRLEHCLTADRFESLGDLISKTRQDLLRVPNLGKKSYGDLLRVLETNDLTLGMDISGWTRPSDLNADN